MMPNIALMSVVGEQQYERRVVATDGFDYANGSLSTVSGGKWGSNYPGYGDQVVTSGVLTGGSESFCAIRFNGGGTFLDNQFAACDAKAAAGYSGQACGLALRISADQNEARDHYTFFAQDNDTNTVGFYISRTVNGTSTTIASGTNLTIVDGTWFRMEFRAIGNRLVGLVNGAVIYEVRDDALTSGRPGITGVSNGGGGIQLDNWEGGSYVPITPKVPLLPTPRIKRPSARVPVLAHTKLPHPRNALINYSLPHPPLFAVVGGGGNASAFNQLGSFENVANSRVHPTWVSYQNLSDISRTWDRWTWANNDTPWAETGIVWNGTPWAYAATADRRCSVILVLRRSRSATGGMYNGIVSYRHDGWYFDGLNFDPNNKLVYCYSGGGTPTGIIGAGASKTFNDTDVHVVGFSARGPSRIAVFGDGEKLGDGATGNNGLGGQLLIGYHNLATNQHHFEGDLFGFIVWDDALTDAEMVAYTRDPSLCFAPSRSRVWVAGTEPPPKPLTVRRDGRRATGQPQVEPQIDWGNPITRGLLVAATPFSRFSQQPQTMPFRDGVACRDGVLTGPAITHGVANSTVVSVDAALTPDNGSWWSNGSQVYGDTNQNWPNDRGLFWYSTSAYGNAHVGARATDGVFRNASISVIDGSLFPANSKRVLVRGATIDADLLVSAWGNGRFAGTSTALQGIGYDPPLSSYAPPMFGTSQPATPDSVTWTGLALRWGRALTPAEMVSITTNPWQVFKHGDRKFIFDETVVLTPELEPRYGRPISDVDVGAWQASEGSDLFAMLDEVTPDDGDYIFVTTRSTTKHKLTALGDYAPGNNVALQFRGKSLYDHSVKVSIVQGASTEIASITQPMTTTITPYELFLTAGEIASITDFTDLYLWIESL